MLVLVRCFEFAESLSRKIGNSITNLTECSYHEAHFDPAGDEADAAWAEDAVHLRETTGGVWEGVDGKRHEDMREGIWEEDFVERLGVDGMAHHGDVWVSGKSGRFLIERLDHLGRDVSGVDAARMMARRCDFEKGFGHCSRSTGIVEDGGRGIDGVTIALCAVGFDHVFDDAVGHVAGRFGIA